MSKNLIWYLKRKLEDFTKIGFHIEVAIEMNKELLKTFQKISEDVNKREEQRKKQQQIQQQTVHQQFMSRRRRKTT